MSGIPAPRPALKKAADAHIHPAAPGQRPVLLRHPDAPHLEHAADGPGSAADRTALGPAGPGSSGGAEAATPVPGRGPRTGGAHGVSTLSGPLGGHTSDSLRKPRRRGRARAEQVTGKKAELTVKIPKALRKEFRAALKAERKDADAVVTALIRSWLDG